jgi:3-oxoacyl-[acyl-carrier-protein] synthase-3
MVRRARIVGTGSYLPDRIIENADLIQTLALSADAIYRRSGIRARRWACAEQTTSDLAEQAARRACEAGGVSPADLDAILLSTTSPDMVFPSTACHLQRQLQSRASVAFDLAASCSGFLYGLSMADRLIRSGQFKRCLVVASEIKSRFLNLNDPGTAILFGDGAGAALVVAEPDDGAVASGILAVRLYSDGSRHDLIQLPAGGSREPTTQETVINGRHTLRMQGGPVFRIAIRRMREAVSDLLKEFGLEVGHLKQVIFHQANGRLLKALARSLGIPDAVLFSVIEQYGNTSSASLPIALDCASREGRLHTGDLVLLGAFGGGMTWSTALMRW